MGTSSDVFTVFYCWQSDTPENHARYLIREALDQATDRLSRSPEVAFKVEIDSDTMNETGLCDIPATILEKISKADAVVADLTFIVKTKKRRHCPNPNVLFELGYAFRAIGPERLVCVMNEKHGPRTEQIFDLNHRRHPVAYTSPQEGVTRRETVEALSKNLEAALRPIIALGPSGSVGGDDERRHESDRARIESYWESNQRRKADLATITFCFRPRRYFERRWPDARNLEAVASRRATWNGRQEFPPQRRGTVAMEWGIYNDMYGEDWAITYAGALWFGNKFNGWEVLKMPERDRRSCPEPPENEMIEVEDWLPMVTVVKWFGEIFTFAASMTNEFMKGEHVEWSVSGQNLDRKWLSTSRGGAFFDLYGPSRSPGLSRSGNGTAAEFRNRWLDDCLECAKEFCDLFSRNGRYVERDVLAQIIEQPG